MDKIKQCPTNPQNSPSITQRNSTKIIRVLKHLATGNSVNRFEAEKQLHDHALPSTISAIQKRYSLVISRHYEIVPCFEGHSTRVCRYWLEPNQRIIALKVLGDSHG